MRHLPRRRVGQDWAEDIRDLAVMGLFEVLPYTVKVRLVLNGYPRVRYHKRKIRRTEIRVLPHFRVSRDSNT